MDPGPNSFVGPGRFLPLCLAYIVATSLAHYSLISLEVSRDQNLIMALTAALPGSLPGPRLSGTLFQLIPPTGQHLAKVSQRRSRAKQVEILVLFLYLFFPGPQPPSSPPPKWLLSPGQYLSAVSPGTSMDLMLSLFSKTTQWLEETIWKLVTCALESSISSFIVLARGGRRHFKRFFHEEMRKSRHTSVSFQISNK